MRCRRHAGPGARWPAPRGHRQPGPAARWAAGRRPRPDPVWASKTRRDSEETEWSTATSADSSPGPRSPSPRSPPSVLLVLPELPPFRPRRPTGPRTTRQFQVSTFRLTEAFSPMLAAASSCMYLKSGRLPAPGHPRRRRARRPTKGPCLSCLPSRQMDANSGCGSTQARIGPATTCVSIRKPQTEPCTRLTSGFG